MIEVLAWTRAAWSEYRYWQEQDRKTLKRINKLIRDTLRHPFEGIGKPEPPSVRIEVHSVIWNSRMEL